MGIPDICRDRFRWARLPASRREFFPSHGSPTVRVFRQLAITARARLWALSRNSASVDAPSAQASKRPIGFYARYATKEARSVPGRDLRWRRIRSAHLAEAPGCSPSRAEACVRARRHRAARRAAQSEVAPACKMRLLRGWRHIPEQCRVGTSLQRIPPGTEMPGRQLGIFARDEAQEMWAGKPRS